MESPSPSIQLLQREQQKPPCLILFNCLSGRGQKPPGGLMGRNDGAHRHPTAKYKHTTISISTICFSFLETVCLEGLHVKTNKRGSGTWDLSGFISQPPELLWLPLVGKSCIKAPLAGGPQQGLGILGQQTCFN